MKIINWWERLNASDKLSLTSIILTAILVIITTWYAISTRTMVNIMQAEFEITNRPYVSISTMDNKQTPEGIKIVYTLMNSGKTPAILEETRVSDISINGNNETLITSNKGSSIINPGEYIQADLTTISGEGLGLESKIKLTLTYRTPSQPNAKYETSYLYLYKGNPELPLDILSSSMK